MDNKSKLRGLKGNINVSVIICAYNEEKYIGQTIRDLLKCPTAQEIIVVDDGSKDKTREILKSFGKKIRLITYWGNRGKGFALFRGIKAARGEVVVFLDAHLENLEDRHLQSLTEPIFKKKANYVLATCDQTIKRGSFFPSLTGQRAYLKQILIPFLPYIKKTRFGVETYLNEIFKPRWGKKIHLEGLIHLVKHQKMPMNEVLPAYVQEILEISKTKLEIRTNQHRQLQKILNPKNIKTLKNLAQKVDEIKDKEISELVKKYVLPYLRKITK